MPDVRGNGRKEKLLVLAILGWLMIVSPRSAGAQDWVWTREVVDTFGVASSLSVDDTGSIHISYGGDVGLKYGYRPAGTKSRWFTLGLGGGVNYTNLKIDRQGNPHLCATYLSLPLRYAHYNGKIWDIQQIAPEDNMSVQAQCSVAIAPDGTPHLSWYRLDPEYKHLRYAALKDGAWQTRTVDFDEQTGKWNSMIIGPDGNPDITYDAFIKGLLKFAHWNGKEWNIKVVDQRGAHGQDYSLGMGSCLFFDSHNIAHISYYTDSELRYASQDGQTWKIETVDGIRPTGSWVDYRSSLMFDKDGAPHISYEDFGVLKHAYKYGDHWRVQVIAPSGAVRSRYSSMAVDAKANIIYIAYKDPVDGSLKVAVGNKVESSPSAVGEKKIIKNETVMDHRY